MNHEEHERHEENPLQGMDFVTRLGGARHFHLLFFVSFVFFVVMAFALFIPPFPVATFDAVKSQWRAADAWILDRHGEPLSRVRIDKSRRRGEWVALKDVSPALVDAVLLAEDHRFREHSGVDWMGLLGAARQTSRGERRGGSTLTMQLAAQLEPRLERGGQRGPVDKWRQLRQALALERAWSKDQILEAWLNLAPFRGEVEGVDAAARTLIGKGPSGLDRAESAILTTLVRAPNANPELVARRACALLDDDTACFSAQRLALGGLRAPRANTDGDAPHLARKLLTQPGERLVSTLDAGLQRFASQTLQRHLLELEGRNVRDGAVVVLDNETGALLAYVGSSGELSRSPEVDGAAAPRLAGSTLKPFLYALAIERRLLTAASILDDSPLAVSTVAGLYVPQNYDRLFKGPVTLRQALAGSLNVPAVRTLELVGYAPLHARLRELGLSTLDRDADHYGFGLALGGGEVTLVDLTRAYRALANGTGMDPRAAYIVSDILADPAARAGTFGLFNALATPYRASVKTGTSKDMRDNWAIGYTRRYTVGVWVGNFSGEAMHDVSGVSGAAPVWRDVMDRLMEAGEGAATVPPAGIRLAHTRLGGLEPDRDEWFIDGTQVERVVALAPGAAQPLLDSPVNGSTFAIDPDIPPDNQRIVVRARGVRGGERLALPDGSEVAANEAYLWAPTRGRHQVALVASDGRVLDRASIEVR
jgi:penicillin-binding protein 1C